MDATTALPIVAASVAVLGVMATYFGPLQKLGERVAKMEGRCDICAENMKHLPQMQADIKEVKDGLNIFWKVVDPGLAQILHAPTHYERDELVDKLVSGEITLKEAHRLETLLNEAMEEDILPGKKLAAALLLGRTQMLIEHWHNHHRTA
jgi:hypothetical protein